MTDAHAALDWLQTHEADARQGWWPTLPLNTVVRHDPARALDWALELEVKAETVESVLRIWASSDPRAVSAWLQQSAYEVRRTFYRELAYSYVEVDMDEALDWLQALPEQRQRLVMAVFVDRARSVEDAERLLEHIDDPAVRNGTVGWIAGPLGSIEASREAIRWLDRVAEREELPSLYFDVFRSLGERRPR